MWRWHLRPRPPRNNILLRIQVLLFATLLCFCFWEKIISIHKALYDFIKYLHMYQLIWWQQTIRFKFQKWMWIYPRWPRNQIRWGSSSHSNTWAFCLLMESCMCVRLLGLLSQVCPLVPHISLRQEGKWREGKERGVREGGRERLQAKRHSCISYPQCSANPFP